MCWRVRGPWEFSLGMEVQAAATCLALLLPSGAGCWGRPVPTLSIYFASAIHPTSILLQTTTPPPHSRSRPEPLHSDSCRERGRPNHHRGAYTTHMRDPPGIPGSCDQGPLHYWAPQDIDIKPLLWRPGVANPQTNKTRQRTMLQMKEQDKTLEKELNEMKIHNLPS